MIKFENVFKSYNGKSGCMCGCNGKYRLPSHTSIEDANFNTGYNAYDQSDVSDRSVKIAVRKINDALNFVGPHPRWFEVGYQDGIAFINDGDRTTVIYTNDHINQEIENKKARLAKEAA